MLSKEILKKVRRIQFKVNRLIDEVIAGHYASVFKGTGIEFSEVREYTPGDEIRTIDWNVTARAGAPFSKRYIEERELTVMLAVDLSASQWFGSVSALKSELAAEISALLAFLAIKNNDRVGLLIFSDRCEFYLPPNKGRRHVLRVIRELLSYQPAGRKTDLPAALAYLNKLLKQKSIIFLLSDFLVLDFEQALRQTIKRHDLVAIGLEDPRESELPALGLVDLRDPETGDRVLVDTADPLIREETARQAIALKEQRLKLFKRNRVDFIPLSTAGSYLEPLQRFFRQREKQRQAGGGAG